MSLMIPGEWERRGSVAVAKAAAVRPLAAPVAAVADPRRRPELATWLEVSIVAIALLGTMVLAMWGSRV